MEASMGLAGMMTPPVIAIIVLIAVITTMLGYAIGRANEQKRKIAELKEADTEAKAAMADLKEDHEQKLAILNKAHLNDIEKLKQEQSEQLEQLKQEQSDNLEQLKREHSEHIDQLNSAHQSLVDSLKSGHSTEIERIGREHNQLINNLNETNNAHVNQLKQEQQQQVTELNERSSSMINQLEERRKSEIAELKQENAALVEGLKREQREATESLRADHQNTLTTLRKDSELAIAEAKQRHLEESERLNQQIDTLKQERASLIGTFTEMEQTIATLEAQIKENKMNNMFSVSKSGDKLIRVVRSVQELANELDETSRAVTNGEYSFFDQIKDQRDKDAVLSLTGGDRAYTGDHDTVEVAIDDEETSHHPDQEV